MTQQDKVNKRAFLKFSGVFQNKILRYLEITIGNQRILVNNFELLNITDQIYMILISSMKYTFIYDIYGNVNFFILFTHQKFEYNLLFNL